MPNFGNIEFDLAFAEEGGELVHLFFTLARETPIGVGIAGLGFGMAQEVEVHGPATMGHRPVQGKRAAGTGLTLAILTFGQKRIICVSLRPGAIKGVRLWRVERRVQLIP